MGMTGRNPRRSRPRWLCRRGRMLATLGSGGRDDAGRRYQPQDRTRRAFATGRDPARRSSMFPTTARRPAERRPAGQAAALAVGRRLASIPQAQAGHGRSVALYLHAARDVHRLSPLPAGDRRIDFSVSGSGLSWEHPLGTDSLGRDMLARMLWGGRISLAVGIIAALVAILLGTAIGAIAGFFGGVADTLLMRLTDLFISLPQVPLLLVISFLYKQAFYDFFQDRTGSGVTGIFVLIVLVIGLLNWMPTARLVRASSLDEAEGVCRSRRGDGLLSSIADVPAHPAERHEPDHRRGHPRSRRGDHHRVGALLSRSWLPVRHPDLGKHALRGQRPVRDSHRTKPSSPAR